MSSTSLMVRAWVQTSYTGSIPVARSMFSVSLPTKSDHRSVGDQLEPKIRG